MVNTAGQSSSPYAPVNEQTQPGVIKYSNDGPQFVLKRRRESAFKKMYVSCNSAYRILSEREGTEGTVPSYHFWYIQYACEPHTDSSAVRPEP